MGGSHRLLNAKVLLSESLKFGVTETLLESIGREFKQETSKTKLPSISTMKENAELDHTASTETFQEFKARKAVDKTPVSKSASPGSSLGLHPHLASKKRIERGR